MIPMLLNTNKMIKNKLGNHVNTYLPEAPALLLSLLLLLLLLLLFIIIINDLFQFDL